MRPKGQRVIYLDGHFSQEDCCENIVGECEENSFLFKKREREMQYFNLICKAVHIYIPGSC